MPTELVLIRHGHCVRIHGDYHNAPLTEIGREQAYQTAQFLSDPANRLDAIYASPLLRARQTAGIIGSLTNQVAELRPGIVEARYPEVFLLMLLEILSINNGIDSYLKSHAGKTIHWPVVGRVSRVLLEVLQRHPGQRVGVVAHAGVISASLSWLRPRRRWRWWRTTVSNCSLTRFRIDDGLIELLAVNEIDHLTHAIISTQPPATAVEAAHEAHPVSKDLIPPPAPAPQPKPAQDTLEEKDRTPFD